MDFIICLVLFIGVSVVAVNSEHCSWAGYFGILIALAMYICFLMPLLEKL